jgi:hypothetical protein
LTTRTGQESTSTGELVADQPCPFSPFVVLRVVLLRFKALQPAQFVGISNI